MTMSVADKIVPLDSHRVLSSLPNGMSRPSPDRNRTREIIVTVLVVPIPTSN